jgi:putative addiction module killer protein
MTYEIRTTAIFNKWAGNLKDKTAARNIALRLARARNGNLGDIASVGDGVSEMRIFIGKGYRLYFTLRKGEIIFLLCGGDKSSQQRDIKQAKIIATQI